MDETHEVGFSFSFFKRVSLLFTYSKSFIDHSVYIEANFISMMSWMKAPNLSSRFPSLQLILIEFPRRVKRSIHHSNKEMQLDHKIESESEL